MTFIMLYDVALTDFYKKKPMALRYIIMLIALSACASPLRVYTDYDPDYNLWRYSKYNFAGLSNPSVWQKDLDSLHEKRVRAAVETELSKRGYVETSQNPEVLLHCYILLDDHTVVSPELKGYFYGPFWMRAHRRKYIDREETFVVDMVDCASQHIVWKGWATTTFHTAYDEKNMDTIIKRTISVMFKDFPRASQKPAMTGSIANQH